MELFFMSPPGLRWALRGRANFRSANAPQVDAKIARDEWVRLADAIEARGGRVVCLMPPDDDSLTGLPYAAEAGHVVERHGERLFLLPNMAARHRKGERVHWTRVAERLGMRPVTLPSEHAVWEAQGDVASFRGRTLLFFGVRTNREGVDAIAPFFPADAIVLPIREPAFHGNMALLPLDAIDRMLVCNAVLVGDARQKLADAFGEDAMIDVTEEEIRSYATNGLAMGHDLLAPTVTPRRVLDLLAHEGIDVVPLSMSELCEKAGGASRCLVSRATIEGEIAIPEDLDYRALRPSIAGSS